MKLKRLTPILTAALFVVAALIYTQATPATHAPTQETPASTVVEQVTLTIDDGAGAAQEFSAIPHVTGMTAFGILEQIVAEHDILLEATDYGDLGTLVTRIGTHANGTDNRYWMYRVNGELPMVAADRYVLHGGDGVEWRFVNEE